MGCCSSKKSNVKVSKEWKAMKSEQKKLVMNQLKAADKTGDGLDISEMRAFLLQPEVVGLLDQLAGGSEEGHAHMMAQTLMAKHDTDGDGVIDRAEGAVLRRELELCITEPFYVFAATGSVPPGGVVWGMVVLQLETPLSASAVSISLQGCSESHFTVPKTHYRTVRTKNGTRRERYTVHHPKHAKEVFISGTQPLFQPPGGVLAPGLHRFRFSFVVPANAPFSCASPSVAGKSPNGNGEGSRGRASISYSLVAHTMPVTTQVVPEGLDNHAKNSKPTQFRVDSPAAPELCNRLGAAAGTHHAELYSKPCCCCCCMDKKSLPRYGLDWSCQSHTGLFTNDATALPMVAPGDVLTIGATLTNKHSIIPVKKASISASFKVRMDLRAGGCTWSGYMGIANPEKSAVVDVSGGDTAALTVTPTFHAPVYSATTQPAVFTTVVQARVKADSGSCASWQGQRVYERKVAAVPAWTHRPTSIQDTESKFAEPTPPSPSKFVDAKLDSDLFGAPVTSVTKTTPAGGIRRTNSQATTGGVATAPLYDVYTYPTPAPHKPTAPPTLTEDEQDFDHKQPPSFLV